MLASIRVLIICIKLGQGSQESLRKSFVPSFLEGLSESSLDGFLESFLESLLESFSKEFPGWQVCDFLESLWRSFLYSPLAGSFLQHVQRNLYLGFRAGVNQAAS